MSANKRFAQMCEQWWGWKIPDDGTSIVKSEQKLSEETLTYARGVEEKGNTVSAPLSIKIAD